MIKWRMTNKMKEYKWFGGVSDWKLFSILLLFSVTIFIVTLGSNSLVRGDETRVAGISSQIAIYGNWLTPELNGRDFLEKPPFYFWINALTIKIFGRTPFGARLASAIFATIGVMAVFSLMRKLRYSQLAAFASSIILASSAQYWAYGHKTMIDIALAVFIAIAFLSFLIFCRANSSKDRIIYFIIFTISLSGAVFSKGLVGLAIPGVALFAYLFLAHYWLKKPEKWYCWVALFAASVLSFIPTAIWVLMLYRADGYNAVYTVVWTNNFGRFTGSHAEHIEPFYYYLLKIPQQLQPWTLFLPFALWWHFSEAKTEGNRCSLFFLCCLIIPYMLLTVSAGKRPVYVLPLYVAEAILIGSGFAYLYEQNKVLAEKIKLSVILKFFKPLFAICVILMGITSIVIARINKVDEIWLIVPIILILFGLCTLFAIKRKRVKFASFSMIMSLALIYAAIDCSILPFINLKKSYKTMFAYAAKSEAKGLIITLLAPQEGLRGGAVYYLGKTVPEVQFKDLEKMRNSQDANKIILIFKGGKTRDLPDEVSDMHVLKAFKVKKKYEFFLQF